MATELEMRAKEAFLDDNFELAVDLYTQALDMDPRNADLFADRAQANIKLMNYTEAVADANIAINLDPSLTKPFLRKGIACIKLGEYQNAKSALKIGASLAPNDVRFIKLIDECDAQLAEKAKELCKFAVNPGSKSGMHSQSLCLTSVESKNCKQEIESTSTSIKPKYRHEYYQKSTEVVVTIFAKGIKPQYVAVEFGEQLLSVTIDVPGEEAYHFQPRLFGKIVPENCRYQVFSSKIEIRLVKVETINWTSLEFSQQGVTSQKMSLSSVNTSQRLLYPSSKSKVDWDQLEAQVKKEEKEEKLDGDAALNKLFQDIYKDADDDMRKAMRKSFVESNGTVLSTNWKEVGSKKVDATAPDGMEMRKWEY